MTTTPRLLEGEPLEHFLRFIDTASFTDHDNGWGTVKAELP